MPDGSQWVCPMGIIIPDRAIRKCAIVNELYTGPAGKMSVKGIIAKCLYTGQAGIFKRGFVLFLLGTTYNV